MSNPASEPVPFAVSCGLDVGRSEHHACALDMIGERLQDRPLPNDEGALREVFERLAEHDDRKGAAAERHNAALICLARRRTDVIYAMLRDRQPYRAPARAPEPVAA